MFIHLTMEMIVKVAILHDYLSIYEQENKEELHVQILLFS